MVDFDKIEDVEVEMERKYDITHHYSQAPGNEGRTVLPDKNTIRFSIKNDNATLDDKIYQIIFKKEEDDIYVKGDFFESSDEWYETYTIVSDGQVEIILELESGKMIFRCYIA